ncbi:MAG: succinyldiaminopimelate transaminase [Streptosporangiales bacterium]|nr:succinyldiaminopimelate transaminase [Streptosporangiales bacterium]
MHSRAGGVTGRVSERLADFPWDRLAPYRRTASAHPGGIVDLSMGTPVDPVPETVRAALAAGADRPGYPATYGTPELREAYAAWARRRLHAEVDPAAVLPTIGSKELVAWLPTLLGLGPGDVVTFPALAYPTYEVGARLAGATPAATDSLVSLGPGEVRLLWVNSPGNPTGRVLPTEHLRKIVSWARERGVIVASDECYIELGWEAEPISMLHPDVCDGSAEGILVVHSLSKRSNLAGYRAGTVAGDPALVRELLEVRRHAGLMVPWPVQTAMVAALGDDEHVEWQRARYAARRAQLRPALERAGWRVSHSEAGLYLWVTHPGYGDCWEQLGRLADLGILVAPGEFYGAEGQHHLRTALTATDERVGAAVDRLGSPSWP